jgi:hypothetical protein
MYPLREGRKEFKESLESDYKRTLFPGMYGGYR